MCVPKHLCNYQGSETLNTHIFNKHIVGIDVDE